MKYSIRGNLNISDGSDVITLLNHYELWRLKTSQFITDNEQEIFSFEVWVNTIEEKNSLFDALKPFVDEYGELIDWHECAHDEEISLPCVITETYTRGE